MISRHILLAAAFLTALVFPAQAQEISDDGLHIQPWFYDGFLEMGADLEDAAAEGKGLIVIFEQRGCPYCRELHEVNLAIPEISEYQAENFYTVQLNLWGDRMVTDFDGEELSEKDLAQKWLVNFTPTVVMFSPESAEDGAESFRMPGYFKPFHYGSAMEYVMSGAFRDTGFQRFTRARFERFEEEGKHPSLWD